MIPASAIILAMEPTSLYQKMYINSLLECQQTLEKSFNHFDNKLYTTNLNFHSDLVGQHKKDKETAKRNLTKYGFDHLFTGAKTASRELSLKHLADGTVHPWPHYRDQWDNQTMIILPGELCAIKHKNTKNHKCHTTHKHLRYAYMIPLY
jgi:hypothetical protein